MKNAFIVLTIAVAALGTGSVGAASGDIEIALSSGKPNYRSAAILQSTTRALQLLSSVPAGQWKLPDFSGRKPAFAVLQLEGKTRLLAIDSVGVADVSTDALVAAFGEKPAQEAKFYNQLYFDANGNGDLTDDPVIKGTVQDLNGSGYYATFAQITTASAVGANAAPYSFTLRIFGQNNKNPSATQCQLSSGSIYTGNASINGATYYFTLVDANVNGSFAEPGVDKLFLSDNKQVPEMYPLTVADMLVIGPASYRVKLDTAASKLLLTPATGLPGKLLVSDSTDCLTLRGPNLSVALLRPAKEVAVPAGSYSVTSYRLSRKDSKERTWFVENKGVMNGPATETTPTTTGTLLYGEPFEVVLRCTKQGKSANAAISMAFNTFGKGKESVAMPTRTDNQARGLPVQYRPSIPPTYRISDSRGALITKGSFQLG